MYSAHLNALNFVSEKRKRQKPPSSTLLSSATVLASHGPSCVLVAFADSLVRERGVCLGPRVVPRSWFSTHKANTASMNVTKCKLASSQWKTSKHCWTPVGVQIGKPCVLLLWAALLVSGIFVTLSHIVWHLSASWGARGALDCCERPPQDVRVERVGVDANTASLR